MYLQTFTMNVDSNMELSQHAEQWVDPDLFLQ